MLARNVYHSEQRQSMRCVFLLYIVCLIKSLGNDPEAYMTLPAFDISLCFPKKHSEEGFLLGL